MEREGATGRTGSARFTAVDRPRHVSARIADQIEARIADGTLAIGQRLPAETELAHEFGVSRPSVREALAALQFVGLVESRRGYGTVVAARSAEAFRDDQPGRRPPRLPLATLGQVLDLFEVRLIVEPAAMALAASDPDMEALELAEDLISGMDVAVEDLTLHASTDIRVHRALLRVCRNELLRESAGELLDLVLDPLLVPTRAHAWASHDRPSNWVEQHRSVCAALRTGDAEQARSHSSAHLVSVLTGLAEVVKSEPGLPARVARMICLTGGEPPDLASTVDLNSVRDRAQEASDGDHR